MNIKFKQVLVQSFVVLAVCLGLAGCAKQPKPKMFVPPPAKPTLNQYRTMLIHQLGATGYVQVIHEGETMRIVVRDDYLFEPDSANIRQSYKRTLKKVARLIRTYDKINVKVSAYLDNQGKTTFLQALSTRQAQVVADFLWYHGIDARLLYSVGYNHLNPVDWNGSILGRSFNRRVEISFIYKPKVKAYS